MKSKSTMKSALVFCIICTLIFSCRLSFATQSAVIFSESPKATTEKQRIEIFINNNEGIMGFRLHFEYSEDEVEILSASKGAVLTKGTMTDNIGLKDGQFDVLWNNTEDIKGDGTLMVLELKLLKLEGIEIKVSFNQPDTFNESWEDVAFECNNIKFDPNENDASEETTLNSESKNNHEIGSEQVVSIVNEIIDKGGITSLNNLSESEQKAFLEKVNESIYSEFGILNYFESFNELKNVYISALKEEVKISLNMLNTNKSAKSIIEDYYDGEVPKEITPEDAKKILEEFKNEGLDNKHLDNLDGKDLAEIFKEIANENNIKQQGNSNAWIVVIIVVVTMLLVVALIIILKKKKRGV